MYKKITSFTHFLYDVFCVFCQNLKIEVVHGYNLPWTGNSRLCARDDIEIWGTYVKVQGEVATEYIEFEENWDLFCKLAHFGCGDLLVIMVQVNQEYIKLIFEKVANKVEAKELDEEDVEESIEDAVEVKQEVKQEMKQVVKEEFND